jgi:hypothetical protein
VKYAVGIIVALITALILTKGLGIGIGLMSLMVIIGLGLMGYGIAEKFEKKGKDDAR